MKDTQVSHRGVPVRQVQQEGAVKAAERLKIVSTCAKRADRIDHRSTLLENAKRIQTVTTESS